MSFGTYFITWLHYENEPKFPQNTRKYLNEMLQSRTSNNFTIYDAKNTINNCQFSNFVTKIEHHENGQKIINLYYSEKIDKNDNNWIHKLRPTKCSDDDDIYQYTN